MRYIDNKTFKPVPGAAVEYLHSLGIQEVESFLYKPKPSDYESPWNLKNMNELVEKLHDGFERNRRFFLQVDSDTDGITSSSIFYRFFTRVYPEANIMYRVHGGKEHGVILDTVPIEADIIITPDAGSNQIAEMESLSASGRTVLVMDHHIMNCSAEGIKNVVVVNCQDGKFHNTQLSGAGVVYKVIQAYCEHYGLGNIYKDYEDLAALGIIADCMDCRTLDNNAIVMNGLAHIHNPMLAEILEHQSAGGLKIKDTSNPNKIDIAFYVAPLINAVIRSGTVEEKRMFFEGFIGIGENEIFRHTFRGTEYEENLYQYLSRTAVNLRAKQNRIKEKSIEALRAMVDGTEKLNDKVLVLKVGSEIVDKNITGLVAMDMVNIYGKPTLVLRPVVETINGQKVVFYRGSGRASETVGFHNFMEELQKTGLMDYVEGHENAFGASIREQDIPALIDALNTNLANVDFTVVQTVDCSMDDSNWSNIVLKEFGSLNRIYGNGIPETKFHFEFDAKISDFKVQGKKFDSLKINHSGVTLIAFKCAELIEKYQAMGRGNPFGRIHVEVIGTSTINSYMGYDNVQIMIKEIELTECKDNEASLF